MTAAAAVLALLAALPGSPRAEGRPDLSHARRWACFYGETMSLRSWNELGLAIVDPDDFALPTGTGPVSAAYVSVGEANDGRWFWDKVDGKSYVLEPNPAWKGAWRVDLRSEEWRNLLLDVVVASAVAKGYRGVMLDTVDVAGYLESSAPARFAGSVQAAAGFIYTLRGRYPQLAIIMNNGLPLLDRVADAIDGVLVEDLYTRCHPEPGACGPTPSGVAREKEAVLKRFREKTGKPVFVLLYSRVQDRDARWVRRAVERARTAGFYPYLTSPSLDRLGTVDPGARR